jgi:hypothetical protein
VGCSEFCGRRLLETTIRRAIQYSGVFGYRAIKISTMVNRQKLATTTAVAMFSSLNSQSIGFSIVTCRVR